MAGMDGNRTHPGRLRSAPQTVLKTAGSVSANVHQRPSEFNLGRSNSVPVQGRPLSSAVSAVILDLVPALEAIPESLLN